MISLIKEIPNRDTLGMACFFKPKKGLKRDLPNFYWLKVPGAAVRNHREILPIAPPRSALPLPEIEKPAEQLHKQSNEAAAEVLLELGWYADRSYRGFMLLGKGWVRRKVIHG